ncbi:MAG TPA: hypothetical protein VG496_10385, partial [Myxococcales bacterium]|nr:hypothetical protein [Myxococcales bacterium]
LLTFAQTSRRELSLHGRYAISDLELDARLELLRTVDGRVELEAPSSLRHDVATFRFDALLPGVAGTAWRPRLGLRAIGSDATGQDAGNSYQVTRWEPGGRIAAQRESDGLLWELGYVFSVPMLRQTGVGLGSDAAPYQDDVYGSCEVSFGKLHLRALLFFQPRDGFGGGSGTILFQF